MPSGTPTTSATAVTVATCQNATALRSRRNIPSTFSSAKSRRLRRADARMNWASTARPSTARTPARITGVASMAA
jgi:hypothetical protein